MKFKKTKKVGFVLRVLFSLAGTRTHEASSGRVSIADPDRKATSHLVFQSSYVAGISGTLSHLL